MDTATKIPLSWIATATLEDEIKSIYNEVEQRAHGYFVKRGSLEGYEMDDWLHAERELLRKPHSCCIKQRNGDIIVEVELPEADANGLSLRIAPTEMLIMSEPDSDCRRVFGVVRFPVRIGMDGIDAETTGNILRTTMAVEIPKVI